MTVGKPQIFRHKFFPLAPQILVFCACAFGVAAGVVHDLTTGVALHSLTIPGLVLSLFSVPLATIGLIFVLPRHLFRLRAAVATPTEVHFDTFYGHVAVPLTPDVRITTEGMCVVVAPPSAVKVIRRSVFRGLGQNSEKLWFVVPWGSITNVAKLQALLTSHSRG